MTLRPCLGLLLAASMVFGVGCGGNGSTPIGPPTPLPQARRVPFLAVTVPLGLQAMRAQKAHQLRHYDARPMYSSTITTTLGSVGIDGSNQRTITAATLEGWFDDISMTPDSKSIVFTHYPVQGALHIEKIDVDGTNSVQLSDGAQSEGWPVINPQGNKIYYTDFSGTYAQIYRMNMDGSGKERVLNLPDVCQHEVNVSPDGNSLVLDMHSDDERFLGTYVVKADGSNPVKVAEWTDVPYGDATFSADGTRVLFSQESVNYWDQIVSVDLTGSNKRLITDGMQETVHPLIFGDRIVVMRLVNGEVQLFSLDMNGGNAKQLTTGTPYKTFHVSLVYQ